MDYIKLNEIMYIEKRKVKFLNILIIIATILCLIIFNFGKTIDRYEVRPNKR